MTPFGVDVALFGKAGTSFLRCQGNVRTLWDKTYWQGFYVYFLMVKPEIADENRQEKITNGQSGPPVIRFTNPSPADKEEEDQDDENRHHWLLFEAQRVGMAEGLHQPEAEKDRKLPQGQLLFTQRQSSCTILLDEDLSLHCRGVGAGKAVEVGTRAEPVAVQFQFVRGDVFYLAHYAPIYAVKLEGVFFALPVREAERCPVAEGIGRYADARAVVHFLYRKPSAGAQCMVVADDILATAIVGDGVVEVQAVGSEYIFYVVAGFAAVNDLLRMVECPEVIDCVGMAVKVEGVSPTAQVVEVKLAGAVVPYYGDKPGERICGSLEGVNGYQRYMVAGRAGGKKLHYRILVGGIAVAVNEPMVSVGPGGGRGERERGAAANPGFGSVAGNYLGVSRRADQQKGEHK